MHYVLRAKFLNFKIHFHELSSLSPLQGIILLRQAAYLEALKVFQVTLLLPELMKNVFFP